MYKKSEKVHIVIKEIKNNAKKLRYALKTAGISRAIWYIWEVKSTRLKNLRVAAQKYCEEDRIEMMEDANFKAGMAGNVAAQCFFLKNKAGWKDAFEHKGVGFGDHININIHLPEGYKPNHERLERLNTERISG